MIADFGSGLSYLTDEVGSVTRPVRQLAHFEKIALKKEKGKSSDHRGRRRRPRSPKTVAFLVRRDAPEMWEVLFFYAVAAITYLR